MNRTREIKTKGTDEVRYIIHCPGCKSWHFFDFRWTFNKNFEKPTFNPSLLVGLNDSGRRCHSYVTDGKIRFLGDCFHDLKNTTVELGDPYEPN